MTKEEKEGMLRNQEGIIRVERVKSPISNITELIAERKLFIFCGVLKKKRSLELQIGTNQQSLGLKSKFARKEDLAYVRENISVPFFWILNDLTISRNFDIKIEGKEEFAAGVDEIPERGNL